MCDSGARGPRYSARSFDGLSWYAAPDGSASGAGSEDDPWDLRSALVDRNEIEPGDILWVRGGLYRLDATLVCSLAGTEDRPVEIRGDPRDERPVLEFTGLLDSAAVHVTGEYVALRRLELKSSDEAGTTSIVGDAGDPRGRGLLVESGLGVRLIDLWVHDFGLSLFESRPSGLEIYDCLFFNCHGKEPDRSHGRALYFRTVEGNTIVGSGEFSRMDGSAAGSNAALREWYTDNDDFDERPTGNWTVLRGDEKTPDAFERTGRLLAFILNWNLAETVELELDGTTEGVDVPELGRQVRVSPVQDPEAYVLRYVADGKISVPMSGWTAKPAGGRDVALRRLPDTLPEFGVFLIQWDVDGEAAPREPLPLTDPGAGMPRAAARAARIAACRITEPAERERCKRERVRAWRAFRRRRGA